MDTVKLANRIRRERRFSNAISPIIATLLLILIAIAAGVVVYAYVLNFVGNSTTGGGQPTTTLQLDTSSSVKGGAGTGYITLYVRNTGGATATISAIYVSGPGITGTVQLTTAETGFTYSNCASSPQYCSTGGVNTISPSSVLQVEVTASALSATISSGTYTTQVVAADGSSFPFSVNVK